MTLAIMQPYLFPYIGYWQLLHAVDTFVVYDDVTYIKGGWINRNNILLNGNRRMFTITLDGASSFKRIKDIAIRDSFSGFIKTLRQNYSKAPFFNEVMELLNRIITFDKSNLAAFIANSISLISGYTGIDTDIVISSGFDKDNSLRGQAKVIDICRRIGAVEYVNAIGGTGLYSGAEFARNGIALAFLKTNFRTYKQFHNEFVPGLSIIDIMMFNSKEEIQNMLDDYELIQE